MPKIQFIPSPKHAGHITVTADGRPWAFVRVHENTPNIHTYRAVFFAKPGASKAFNTFDECENYVLSHSPAEVQP